MTPEKDITPETMRQRFAREVAEGLAPFRGKHLSSKWFYDARGSELFKKICEQPEYYLTACEREIFETHGRLIMQMVTAQPVDIIELGCGDGHKTSILLRSIEKTTSTEYIPIDISPSALEECVSNVRRDVPHVPVKPIAGDFYEALNTIRERNRTSMLMFLGSNIGNMEWKEAINFFKTCNAKMRPGDFFLIGFDLIKDPEHILIPAYADAAGVTAAFNKNLLLRINEELGGTFDTNAFEHHASYNFHSNAMESFLISKKKQEVWVAACKRSFHFDPDEAIYLERSAKFTPLDIAKLASAAGFEVLRDFSDSRGYFVDSLWQKKI